MRTFPTCIDGDAFRKAYSEICNTHLKMQLKELFSQNMRKESLGRPAGPTTQAAIADAIEMTESTLSRVEDQLSRLQSIAMAMACNRDYFIVPEVDGLAMAIARMMKKKGVEFDEETIDDAVYTYFDEGDETKICSILAGAD